MASNTSNNMTPLPQLPMLPQLPVLPQLPMPQLPVPQLPQLPVSILPLQPLAPPTTMVTMALNSLSQSTNQVQQLRAELQQQKIKTLEAELRATRAENGSLRLKLKRKRECDIRLGASVDANSCSIIQVPARKQIKFDEDLESQLLQMPIIKSNSAIMQEPELIGNEPDIIFIKECKYKPLPTVPPPPVYQPKDMIPQKKTWQEAKKDKEVRKILKANLTKRMMKNTRNKKVATKSYIENTISKSNKVEKALYDTSSSRAEYIKQMNAMK